MPSLVTHAIYGDLMIRAANQALGIQEAVKTEHDAFWLGCQGPDLFFYYRPYDFSAKTNEIRKYPGKLHEHKIDETFTVMVQTAKASGDTCQIAYVAGFLCHWALDMKCHPYIFYRTQIPNKPAYPQHQYFEAAIDQAIAAENGYTLTSLPPESILNRRIGVDEKITDVLAAVLKEEYAIDLPVKVVSQAFNDFQFVERFFYSPTGRKKRVFSGLEKIIRQPHLATALIIPTETDEKLDPLNRQHQPWTDPCDEKQVFTTSFIDLGKQAIQLADQVLCAFDAYLNGKASSTALTDLIQNRSFKTGYPEGVEMYCYAAGRL